MNSSKYPARKKKKKATIKVRFGWNLLTPNPIILDVLIIYFPTPKFVRSLLGI